MPFPRISVAILSYNFEKYIDKCISSILSQTLRPYEIIVCDDHSNDSSWEIIKKYYSMYPDLFKIFQHKKRTGIVNNSSFWYDHVEGEYTSWLDGDDYWLPQKLEMEYNALKKNPYADIAYSNVLLVDENDTQISCWHNAGKNQPEGDVFIDVYTRHFFLNTRSVFRNEFVTMKAFLEEGYQDKNLTSYWDYDRKIRYTCKFNVVFSGGTHVVYRQNPLGFSKGNINLHYKAQRDIYIKYKHLLRSRSFYEQARVVCNNELLLTRYLLNVENNDDCLSIDSICKNIMYYYSNLNKDEKISLRNELVPTYIAICKNITQYYGQLSLNMQSSLKSRYSTIVKNLVTLNSIMKC